MVAVGGGGGGDGGEVVCVRGGVGGGDGAELEGHPGPPLVGYFHSLYQKRKEGVRNMGGGERGEKERGG